MREPDVLVRTVRTYGYIIDREDEAEEFIDWFEELYLNTFKARTEGLSEDKKSPDDPNYGGMLDVDPEFVVLQNPDFIFKAVGSWISGYDIGAIVSW